MKRLRLIWFVALKDLKLFATDRMALFFFVGFPFLFVIMFNFLLGNVASEDSRLTLHLATQESGGGLSYQIVDALETKDESQLEPGDPRIVWLKDYDEAHQKVEDKEIEGFLAFPSDFTEGIMTGTGTQVEVVADAEAINSRAALYGLAHAIASRTGAEQVTLGAIMELLGDEGGTFLQPSSDEVGMMARQSFIEFDTEKVGEVEAEAPSNYVIPGYLVMFVFFAAALSAETIVRERQNHTLERLLSSIES